MRMSQMIERIMDRIAYERESYRMSTQALEQSVKDHPFPPFRERIRMTDADLATWRREQKRRAR